MLYKINILAWLPHILTFDPENEQDRQILRSDFWYLFKMHRMTLFTQFRQGSFCWCHSGLNIGQIDGWMTSVIMMMSGIDNVWDGQMDWWTDDIRIYWYPVGSKNVSNITFFSQTWRPVKNLLLSNKSAEKKIESLQGNNKHLPVLCHVESREPWANQRPVSRSRDHPGPIRGQYQGPFSLRVSEFSDQKIFTL